MPSTKGLAASLCPFPHLSAVGALESGWSLEVDRICKKCPSQSCIAWFRNMSQADAVAHFVCEYELVSYAARVGEDRVLVAGVFNRDLTLVRDKAQR